MKLIAVLVGLAVVVLVVVGYELLMKLAKKQNKQILKDLDGLVDDYYVDQQEILNLKNKINEPNESDSTESKPKTTKSKSKSKSNGK